MKALNNNLDVISETNEGITTTITRNNDLVTAVETKDSTNTAINTFTKTTVYGTDESGNPTITETDEFGQQIMYTMDSIWGSVESVSLYKDDEWQTLIIDEYDDDMCALTKRTFGSTSGRYNALTYSNGNLSTMETDSLGYDFEYTNGKLSAVSKNDVTIEEHAHTGNTTTESFYPSNGSALHTTVANFDIYGHMTSIEDVLEVEYKNLIRINNETPEYDGTLRDCFAKTYVDRLCSETTNFVHDIAGKVIRTDVTNTSSNILIRQESFAHDGLSRLNKSKLKYDFTSDKSVATTIDYVKEECDPFPDQRVSKYIYGVNCSDNGDVENIALSAENCDVLAETTNTYDNFKRITAKEQVIGGKLFNKQFTFNKTRVTSTRETVGNVTTNSTVYQYNGDLGRVSAVVTGGYTTSYHYDQFGQLVRENNQALDTTFVYVYDNDTGNLTSVKKYAYTASSSSPSGTPAITSFGYSADKLDTFDDATIAYNTMGCPTTYEGKTAIWARGKLSRLSVGTMATGISNYAYTYNAFGQRIGKTYTYTPGKSASAQLGDLLSYSKSYYYDHAGRLISESVFKTYYGTDGSSENIVFLYDESGIIGMARTVGSTTNAYYFQRNLLGDVVAIYDTNGNMVAKYLYDAWGNCTVSSETTNTVVANANPIRYRGYYYDEDTGLYYCNARYYSPKWRRFISPDDTAYLDPESVNGLNLYCYCNNDPIAYHYYSPEKGAHIVSQHAIPSVPEQSAHKPVFNVVLAQGSFASGSFFGKGTVTGLYASGHARAQISLKNGKFVVGAFGKFSFINATGQIGHGNEDLNVSLVGIGDIGTISGMAGILIDPAKNTYFVGIEAKAAVFTARGGVQFEIFDNQIEIGASINALSAGFQFGIGLRDGEFYFGGGFAVLFGYDYYIRIKFA